MPSQFHVRVCGGGGGVGREGGEMREDGGKSDGGGGRGGRKGDMQRLWEGGEAAETWNERATRPGLGD